MITRVQKWGNSQGLRVTKELLDDAQIGVGDEVKVSVRAGRIIVEPVARLRGKYKLAQLVAKIPKGYRPEQLDWGPPAGRESW